ncbi:CRISPR-associated protein (TIGR03986 family) [Micromonospora sp. Llam0]|uniref:RAMP superfamily CRISPR-associated protein n=1 Tax=Micromonospora sp. Llam0 TaxID=2485143 RepID=UPI000F9A5277|nr:RAMP superfamily CRISPR-associated protein [Micromonospora sp. Llam0]ROO59621.1 CRISPR-associated protein (TIGR03986 family) [Micromonospora sp. Llam0]
MTGTAAVECRVTFKNGQAQLSPSSGHKSAATSLPLDDVGLQDGNHIEMLNRQGRFYYFGGRIDGLVGCWQVEGGLSQWLTADAERKATAKAAKAARQEKRAEEDRVAAEQDRKDSTFVNPYTFVPFPERIERNEPAGHAAMRPGHLSGWFTVRWEFTSPLQAPDGSSSNELLRLQGASVKGAVRSLHENLAGGCLRVFDNEYVPSYRDPVKSPGPEWTLARVVDTTQEGQPLTVRPCDQVVWVRSEQLHQAYQAEDLRTGCLVDLRPPAKMNSLGRYELAADEAVTSGGDWHVLLSDAGARPIKRKHPETKKEVDTSYFAACGHLDPATPPVPVAESAWLRFRQAVAGAKEVQQARAADRGRSNQAADPPVDPAVTFRGRLIGRRKRTRDRLECDDLIWVRHTGSEVTGLRLAQVWRHPGDGPMGERVPKHLRPCTDWKSLCPSCQAFGSVDPDPRDTDERAAQRAYAGHVRFGDAVSAAPVPLTRIRRAPLGNPRPGAGQFYLQLPRTDPAKREDDPPTREWGAVPDQGASLRQMAGRKFYWHADPLRQPQGWQRHIARPYQTGDMVKENVGLAPAGTVLIQRITFDNLSEAALGGLLAALEPHRIPALADERGRLLLRLGGGKPLGLGSCQATVTDLTVATAASRYGDADPVTPDVDRYVQRFVDATLPEVQAVWPALAAVLAEETVDPERVWYPPGERWDDRPQQPGSRIGEFDQTFEFFKRSSGQFLKNAKPRPLVPLPKPTDADQRVPIFGESEPGEGKSS